MKDADITSSARCWDNVNWSMRIRKFPSAVEDPGVAVAALNQQKANLRSGWFSQETGLAKVKCTVDSDGLRGTSRRGVPPARSERGVCVRDGRRSCPGLPTCTYDGNEVLVCMDPRRANSRKSSETRVPTVPQRADDLSAAYDVRIRAQMRGRSMTTVVMLSGTRSGRMAPSRGQRASHVRWTGRM